MTTTEADVFEAPTTSVAARSAAEVGQATAVEQARAVAEVQGAIVVAQQCPRSVTEAVRQMRESCSQMGLAERAFFRYSRGGSQITGPSVHVARELARCWGNMQYGITELRRDDDKGESEMLAFAWDVQTNTRATTTFIVKHGRDTKDGRRALTDLRDIYENNANNGARRLREQIFAIIPKWFVEEALELCRRTVEKGESDLPLSQRVASLVKAFGEMGVSVEQLERKIGRRQDAWTAHDVATLTVVGRSVRNGEATVEDEFPDANQVTAAEISASKRAQSKPPKAPEATAGEQVSLDAPDPSQNCSGCGFPAGEGHDADCTVAAA